MTKEEAKKILTEYVKACREDDMFTLEQFTYEEVIEAMDIGAEAISVLPVSSDLEEAARHSEILTYPMPEDGDIEKVFKVQEARVFHEIGFIAGAKWQKAQSDKELSEKIAAAYQLGLADKKKQMMKEAVEGEVIIAGNDGYSPHADVKLPNTPYFHLGRKVKVIIVKED